MLACYGCSYWTFNSHVKTAPPCQCFEVASKLLRSSKIVDYLPSSVRSISGQSVNPHCIGGVCKVPRRFVLAECHVRHVASVFRTDFVVFPHAADYPCLGCVKFQFRHSPSFPGRLPPDRPRKIHRLNISFRENTCLSITVAVTWRQVALVIKHPTYCGCLLLLHQSRLDTAFSAFRCSSP